MGGKNVTDIKDFLSQIKDEKLKNFSAPEKTLVENKNLGFRLDHQGVNSDGSHKDRLYIQPLGHGKSKASKMPPSSVLAQIHVTDPGKPKEIREALLKSFKNSGELVKLS